MIELRRFNLVQGGTQWSSPICLPSGRQRKKKRGKRKEMHVLGFWGAGVIRPGTVTTIATSVSTPSWAVCHTYGKCTQQHGEYRSESTTGRCVLATTIAKCWNRKRGKGRQPKPHVIKQPDFPIKQGVFTS